MRYLGNSIGEFSCVVVQLCGGTDAAVWWYWCSCVVILVQLWSGTDAAVWCSCGGGTDAAVWCSCGVVLMQLCGVQLYGAAVWCSCVVVLIQLCGLCDGVTVWWY